MSISSIPTLEEFLVLPNEEVAKVAPTTMIYGVGGTRRHAAFVGIEPWSDEYIRWGRESTISCIDLLFRLGVRNVITLPFVPSNLQEVNRYRDLLIEKVKWGLAGSEALADYKRLGWRVRLLGAHNFPELKEVDEQLRLHTQSHSLHTLFWSITPHKHSNWNELLTTLHHFHIQTQTEAILALYGEEIPPASLYLAFGKPLISTDIIPPLLFDELQCYWSQQPGYSLTEKEFRIILYDYAYLRKTWQEEKLERAKEALMHREAWEQGPILGLGMRLGPFWYPAPMSSPAWTEDTQ